jgi:hypothetical protein
VVIGHQSSAIDWSIDLATIDHPNAAIDRTMIDDRCSD